MALIRSEVYVNSSTFPSIHKWNWCSGLWSILSSECWDGAFLWTVMLWIWSLFVQSSLVENLLLFCCNLLHIGFEVEKRTFYILRSVGLLQRMKYFYLVCLFSFVCWKQAGTFYENSECCYSAWMWERTCLLVKCTTMWQRLFFALECIIFVRLKIVGKCAWWEHVELWALECCLLAILLWYSSICHSHPLVGWR